MGAFKSLYTTEQKHSWELLLINWGRTYDHHPRWSQKKAFLPCGTKQAEILSLKTGSSATFNNKIKNITINNVTIFSQRRIYGILEELLGNFWYSPVSYHIIKVIFLIVTTHNTIYSSASYLNLRSKTFWHKLLLLNVYCYFLKSWIYIFCVKVRHLH